MYKVGGLNDNICTFYLFCEGTFKSVPFNSYLDFAIFSDFKMKNVIIWHWFIICSVQLRTRSCILPAESEAFFICLCLLIFLTDFKHEIEVQSEESPPFILLVSLFFLNI